MEARVERRASTRAVVSTIHVKHLRDMAPADSWPPEFHYGIDTYDVGVPGFATYYATTAPPEFQTPDGPRTAVSAGLALPLSLIALPFGWLNAAAEVATLADRLGVAHTALRETVAGGPLASGVAMTKLAKMESGDYSPDFSLEWALKDLDLARAAGGVEVTPVAESIAERWRRLVAEGYGRLDISAARKGLGSAPAGAANGQSA